MASKNVLAMAGNSGHQLNKFIIFQDEYSKYFNVNTFQGD